MPKSRASAPHARLRAMRRLHDAGIPVGVMVAPVIPWINDAELEAVLEAARDAGASTASCGSQLLGPVGAEIGSAISKDSTVTNPTKSIGNAFRGRATPSDANEMAKGLKEGLGGSSDPCDCNKK